MDQTIIYRELFLRSNLETLMDFYLTSQLARTVLNSKEILYALANKHGIIFGEQNPSFNDFVKIIEPAQYKKFIEALGNYNVLEIASGHLYEAARQGQLTSYDEILNYMIRNQYKNITSIINQSLIDAAKNGQILIVQEALKLGATEFGQAFGEAAINGHLRVVEILFPYASNYEKTEAMEYAAENGKINVVKYLIDSGVTKYRNAAQYAEENGHTEIVRLLSK